MAENMRTHEVAPSAKTLIESMRDLGYTLETALADIIDNSVAAGATNIAILADFNEGSPRIGVIDDGRGLSEHELLEAMRPGSRSPLEARDQKDLGRFGLGLKTASFSQCRRLSVVTRQANTTCTAIWDLDYVAEVDRWCVQLPDAPTDIAWSDRLGSRGTLVLWEEVDRLLEQATSAENQQHFNRRLSDASEHLELVFHRYLAGEPGLTRIRIEMNGRKLEARDPFCGAICDASEHLGCAGSRVTMTPFTLPHHSKVSNDVWRRNEGRGGYLKNQGFYVYREKRLIIHGTWFGLARQTELTKLARVRIDIPNGVDADWNIDVMKARAHPPYAVRERLRRLIERIGASSTRVYTQRRVRLTTGNRLPVWDRVVEGDSIVYRIKTDHPLLTDFASRLNEDDKSAFERVVELISSAVPLDALCADLGNEPEKVAAAAMEGPQLRAVLNGTVSRMRAAGIENSDIFDILATAEPFRSNWEVVQNMLHDLGIRKDVA